MKRTFIIVAVCIATVLHAQKFEIGTSAGASMNDLLKTKLMNSFVKYDWGALNYPYISVTAIRNFSRWQLGMAVDYCPLSYWTVHVEDYKGALVNLAGPSTETPQYTQVGRGVCYPVKIFANRKWTLKKIDAYTGVCFGYIIDRSICIESVKTTLPYTVGIHFGGTYFFNNRFGLNPETGADYLSWTSPYTSTISHISVPFTIGLRYKL